MKKFCLILCSTLSLFATNPAGALSEYQDFEDELRNDLIQRKLNKEIDQGIQKAIEKSKSTTLDHLSGFVLGVSTGLKNVSIEQITKAFQQIVATTPSLNAGLTLGYQYFFNQYAGLRVSAVVDVGTQARIKAQRLVPAIAIKSGTKPIVEVSQEYLPIHATAGIEFLSTLFRNDKHAFGLSAGIGYEAEWYVVKKADATLGNEGALINLTQKPSDIINHGLYPQIGVYYYYKGNQFELAYRFGQFSFADEKARDWDIDAGGGIRLPTKTKFLFNGELVISYLYRF